MSLRKSFIFHNCAVLLIVIITFKSVDSVEYYTEKPAYIKTCKILEPGFTKCSTESIQQLMDQIIIGIPEITESFGKIEPITLDKLIFKQDNNNVATISANLTNVVITGFGEMKIKESKVSKKDFSWETKIFLPRMRLDSDYKMGGRILLIPLNGAGRMFIEIENLEILMHSKTRLYEKDGFTFYNVTRVNVDLNLTRARTNIENIFNGHSKDVEKSTNQFFNDNWREFFEALRPLINETVERILLKMLKSTFDLFPANFFVEDIPSSEQLYNKAKQ